MTFEEVEHIISKITYKPNWKMEVQQLGSGSAILIVSALMRDTYHPEREEEVLVGFREPIPPPGLIRDTEHILQIVRKVIGKIELHERDEWFRFDGDMIFNPHAIPGLPL